MGIREPMFDATIVVPDVILLPLLSFDRFGRRLGYGGGYYDRSLETIRRSRTCRAIGLAYDAQEVDEVPHLDYDQTIDGVLTESGGRCFAGPTTGI
jgi:5-formyltetrahydrofolate cyclo-ligase